MSLPIIARGSLGGRPVRSLDAAGFVFTETRHAPGLTLPSHANDRATAVAVLRGDYAETLGGRSDCHPPGTLILRPPGEVHSNSIGRRGAHCLLVEITAARLAALRPHRTLFHRPLTIPPGAVTAAALRATRELAHLDDASPLVLESLALELMAHTVRYDPGARGRAEPAWLPRVRDLLDGEGERVTLITVARRVGIHPVYFARTFRAHFGCSVGEYVRRRQVARACGQLASSDLPLSEIALTCGFHDQSHFSRVFRRYSAMSPGAYRRAAREGSNDAIRVWRVLDDARSSRHSPGNAEPDPRCEPPPAGHARNATRAGRFTSPPRRHR
jgi:AraC family transcriptional regulator